MLGPQRVGSKRTSKIAEHKQWGLVVIDSGTPHTAVPSALFETIGRAVTENMSPSAPENAAVSTAPQRLLDFVLVLSLRFYSCCSLVVATAAPVVEWAVMAVPSFSKIVGMYGHWLVVVVF